MKSESFKTIKRQLELYLPCKIKIDDNDCILHINRAINDVIKISYIMTCDNKLILTNNSQIHMYYIVVDRDEPISSPFIYNNEHIKYVTSLYDIYMDVRYQISKIKSNSNNLKNLDDELIYKLNTETFKFKSTGCKYMKVEEHTIKKDPLEQRIKILNNIFSNLQQITQWLPNNIEYASKYINKAESLIELLEVEDCDSVGGYDKLNPIIRVSGFNLYDRFITLAKKYDNHNDIQKCCQFDLNNLGEYFKRLTKLREEY